MIDEVNRFDDGDCFLCDFDDEEDLPESAVQVEETDADRESIKNIFCAVDALVPMEVGEDKAPILSREQLREQYAVHVVELRSGSAPPQYSVFWNGHFAFSTTNSNIQEEFARNGVHRISDLTDSPNFSLVNYDAYLKTRYGAHLISIRNGARESYALFIDGKSLEAGSMAELQALVEKGNYKCTTSDAPEKVTIVRMPDGKTSISYPDGSEVVLSAAKAPVSFKTSDGSCFRRTQGGPPEEWSDGNIKWKGSFTFTPRGALFSFSGDAAKESVCFRGDGTREELYTNKSSAVYRGDELISFKDKSGTVKLGKSGDAVEIISAEGHSEKFAKVGGKWKQADELAGHDELVKLHRRVAQVYEAVGRFDDAAKAQAALIAQLEHAFVPGRNGLAIECDRMVALSKAAGDQKSVVRYQNQAAEIRRVSDYLKELREAVDPIAYSSSIIKRLPEKIKVEAVGAAVRFDCSDFVKLLQSIPGLRVDDASSVSGLKAVRLEGNQLRVDGTAKLKFSGPNGTELELMVKDVTGELKSDATDPSKMTLENIKGVSAGIPPLMVNINKLSMQLVDDGEGNLTLCVVPFLEPGPLTNMIGKNIEPIRLPLGHKNTTPLTRVFAEIRQWGADEKGRNAAKLAESISSLFIDKEFAGLIAGVQSVEKDGDRVKIKTTGGNHNLGGLFVGFDKEVGARVINENGRLALTDITGARFSMPLPGDLAAALGVGGNVDIAVTEVSFSAPDAKGIRTATIKSNGAIESVTVKVDKNMQPVTVDGAGNIAIDVALKKEDQRISLQVKFNPEKAKDPLKTDFSLIVNGNSDAAPAAIEAFFGNQLDPVLRNALRGIQSIEKRGDQVTIKRANLTNLELQGLNVRVGTEVKFRAKPGDSVSLFDISGISITRLPGLADTIYRERLPVVLRSFSLSAAGGNGERTMSISSSGPLRSASIRLDGAMNPKDTTVVVENPVTAFKETLNNATALRMIRLRTQGNDTYTIRVDSSGNVDLGGLNNLADMFSNAGDLLSFEGALITATGYVAQTIANPGNPLPAAQGLWGAIERTWNSIFD